MIKDYYVKKCGISKIWLYVPGGIWTRGLEHVNPTLYQLSYQGLMKFGLLSGTFTSVTQRSLKEKSFIVERSGTYGWR